jgi:hypothetical protein
MYVGTNVTNFFRYPFFFVFATVGATGMLVKNNNERIVLVIIFPYGHAILDIPVYMFFNDKIGLFAMKTNLVAF